MECATVISLHFRMQSHAAQRSNFMSEATPYSNTSRGLFVAKSKAMKK